MSSMPPPRSAATAKALLRKRERQHLRTAMSHASDYAEWSAAAQAFDEITGRDRWKQRTRSGLYDYRLIGQKLDRLQQLLDRGDDRGLMFEIEEGIHGNLGGIGKPILYTKARFGTKRQISDYVAALDTALHRIEAASEQRIPTADKADLLTRASLCFGRTALMMSSGGTLMYFHFGVAKTLFEQGLLPQVISGSSAGAITAAILGTRTDDELRGLFTPEQLYFGARWEPNRIERMTGLRRFYGGNAFDQTFERLIPDLTFREAYQRSGRDISISVSPCERHQSPRLLNALTSPHVLIRSAVRASCAVPGLFEPVQLLARDASGNTVPFLDMKWIDGVFAADLPAKQLARLYGTNHYLVSYINPVLLPTFRDRKTEGQALRPAIDMIKGVARHALTRSDRLLGRYLPSSSAGVVNKLAHDILAQNFVGDVTITPRRRLFSPLRLLSPMTAAEIHALMHEGERQTWPRLEMIRTSSQISRTLDRMRRRMGATVTTFPSGLS